MNASNIKTRTQIATTFHWAARIWGALVIVFVILMFGVELFEHLSGTPKYFIDSVPAKGFEIIGVLLNPILLFIGIIIAFKWEGLGGLIIIGAMIAEWIMEGMDKGILLLGLDGFFIAPGILFLIYWFLSGNQKEMKDAD